MPDVALITGNLVVSGNTNLYGSTYIPSGYVNNSFLPYNPNTNASTYEPRYVLSNGAESSLPFAFVGPPASWPYATGVLIKFGFYGTNIDQLPTWINTMKWLQVTGDSLSPWTLRTGQAYVINKTGEKFKLPWTSFSSVPNRFFIKAIGVAFNLTERLDHLENSGAFALLSNHKIGFGTHQPTEKLEINGNIRVENTGFFESVFINGKFFDAEKTYNPTFTASIDVNNVFGDNLH